MVYGVAIFLSILGLVFTLILYYRVYKTVLMKPKQIEQVGVAGKKSC